MKCLVCICNLSCTSSHVIPYVQSSRISLLPYSYFLHSDVSTSLSSQETFELFDELQPTDVCKKSKELLRRTEEGKMCTVKYTIYQTWLCVCMCNCFYKIGVGYGTCHNEVSAERPYEHPLPFIRYARARTCRTPVCVVLGRPFW